jgi:DNA repair exonuclease SbcCD ATPase subunit
MNETTSNNLLERLETGLQKDSLQLQELGEDLRHTLRKIRDFSLDETTSPGPQDVAWHDQWATVEQTIEQIQQLTNQMDLAIQSTAPDRLAVALSVWSQIQLSDAQLVTSLNSVRDQVSTLNPLVHRDWNLLARGLESHFATIHACAQAIQTKLEILTEHALASEELERPNHANIPQLTKRVEPTLAVIPQMALVDASAELEKRHHEPLGFMDSLNAMLMWNESTDTRARSQSVISVAPPES